MNTGAAPARKKKIRKHTKKPLGVLKRKLDSAFAKLIRDRDYHLGCISCPTGDAAQAGHFMGRATLSTRWHPQNVNGQCCRCNNWMHGMLLHYQDNLDLKYGAGTAKSLRELATQSWKPSREALEALLATAQIGPEAYQETWDFYGAKL